MPSPERVYPSATFRCKLYRNELYFVSNFRTIRSLQIFMRFNPLPTLDRERDQDIFEGVTEEEIIYLWRSIKGKGLSENEAWQAIITGITLDMAFAKPKSAKQLEH